MVTHLVYKSMGPHSITIKSEDDDHTVLDRSIYSEMETISPVLKSEIKEETISDDSVYQNGDTLCNLKTGDDKTTENKSLCVDAISTLNKSVTGLDSLHVAEDSRTNNSSKEDHMELVKESVIQSPGVRDRNVLGEEVLQMQCRKGVVQKAPNLCLNRLKKTTVSKHQIVPTTNASPYNNSGSKTGSIDSDNDSDLIKKSPKKPQEFICDTCNKKFAQYYRISNHVLTHIYDRQRYTCKYCPKEFLSIQGKNLHEMIHTGKRPVECDKCGMCFRTWRNLRNHEFEVHEKRMPYLCDVCGKSFGHVTNYKRHITVHTGEKKLECRICNKRFRLYRGLADHLKTHQKLVCEVCPGTFGSKRELIRHKMTHNKKAYQCDQCEASFDQNCNLTKHKVIHTGIKPHKCHICASRCYNHRSSLILHFKTAHNLTPKSAGWLGTRHVKTKTQQ